MPTKQKITATQMGVLIAALSMYFMSPTHSLVNAVSTDIMGVYNVNENAISYLISITNLLEIPAAFLVGVLGGRRLGYKPLAVIASVLVLLGGAPAILGASLPFWGLMVTRCLLGLGLGCFMPIAQAVVALMFTQENTRATMLGVGSIAFNVGMITLTSAAGFLGAVSWNLAWGAYLIALLPLALVLFFFRKDTLPTLPAETEGKKAEKVKIKIPTFGWVLLVLFLGSIIMSQSLFNIGGATVGQVTGNPALVGTIFSCFSIGAIIPAITFGIAYKFLKSYAVPMYFVIGVIGYLCWYLGHTTASIPLFYVGIILAGIGTNAMTIGVPMILSTAVVPGVVAAVMGFSYVFQNGGGFLASPIDQVVASVLGSQVAVFMFNVVLGAIIAGSLFVIAGIANKKRVESVVPQTALDDATA
ncbi:MAG: MFS transporter [Coriobacteriia bacterium]